MIDGDALWRSDKLAAVQPPEFRAEYANLIPLALADGSFEAGARRVWADVYSYNRPDISPENVEKILLEFERVGLLVRKTEGGKIWGYWVGIAERLPCESHRDRYKSGKASIFNNIDIPQHHPEPIRTPSGLPPSRIGLDRIGLDRIGGDREFDSSTPLGQGTWKFIASRHRDILGKYASKTKKNQEEYRIACSTFGEDRVLEVFNEWALQNKGWLSNKDNALFFFWKELPDLMEADASRKPEEQSSAQEIKEVSPIVEAQIELARIETEMRSTVKKQEQEIADKTKDWVA